METILAVEDQLFKRKARPGQVEAIEWWRKEAHKRQEKEQGKVEKALRMSAKAKQEDLQDKGREVLFEQRLRESDGNEKGIYPLLQKYEYEGPPERHTKDLPPIKIPSAPQDPIFPDLLDIPPPYFINMLQPIPIPPPAVLPPTRPESPLTQAFPPTAIDSLSAATQSLRLSEDIKKDTATGGFPPSQTHYHCPYAPMCPLYPPTDEEGKMLSRIWEKIGKIPAVKDNMDGITEYMLRGGDHEPFRKIMLGKTKKQQRDIYAFLLNIFVRYFEAKKKKLPKKVRAEKSKWEEEEDDEEGDKDGIDGKMEKLLDLISENRHKLQEESDPQERTLAKQHPVRQLPPITTRNYDTRCSFPEGPTSEELYEETEKDLDWFLENEPPFTIEEQELARAATLWTSQPKLYNPDIIAQMYSDLSVSQRRIASLYMTQHLMTLNKFLRQQSYALDNLMSKCTSLDFLQDPSKFLNTYFNARQEYHEGHTRVLPARRIERTRQGTAGLYPIREVHPRMNAANTGMERVFVYTPLTKLEIMKMKEAVPPHSKDPVGFFKELTDVLTMGTYTLSDLVMMLQKLLPPGIYEKLRAQNWTVDNVTLDWATLETHDRDRVAGADLPEDVKTAPTLILKILPQLLTTRKEDWDAISACKQKPDEDIGDYYSRLEKCFTANSGLKLDSESYTHLFVSKLVENSLPKLKERVQRVESSWQAQSPSQVLRILQYHQNRIRQEEESERTRVKETKLRALVAQTMVPRAEPPTSQGPKKANTAKGICNYCKKPGHYVKDIQGNVTCPVLKHNVATGKTTLRVTTPRPQQTESHEQTQMYLFDDHTGYPEFPNIM
ncbi:hypothetical protein NDU88_003516 [Pleurodeles waltl]|uniref:Uncharacterized protein n=1 Tax=Pleurodeles waltl TaxID=8319 RepID=A0AAV7NGW0_PLEWA|nr:hypothetical protein NDU88_003516 [Pleurodeles waltl]